MNRPLVPLALLVAALSSACAVTDVHVVPGRAWTALGGGVAATDLDDPGALRKSSLEDLGIGGRRSSSRLSVEWAGMGDRWELFGHTLDAAGSGELADDLHLDGVELRFDEGDVDTQVHLGVFGLRWLRPVAQRGALHVGLGASLLVAEFDLDLDQDVLDTDTGIATGEHKATGKSALMPFPVPAVELLYAHEEFEARLSLAGLWVWVDEGSGHVVDMDFQLRVPVLDEIGELVLGYHQLGLELDHDGSGERVSLDLRVGGPYLALRVGF
jgi:hypothetical protein